jgi:redox-sensitive bicupin YhaK (pirin superfamily)
VWRPFPGGIDTHVADPFFLLDQMGPVEYAPNEPKGAPWHPHRGFETVTYMIDGVMEHHDSNGGGGVIREGDTQWMTAGAGILHDEVPSRAFVRSGGLSHGVQLWVNLPARLKMSPPRYQAITSDNLVLLSSPDGGTLVRLIAGDLDGHHGPGSTHTPISYAHASLRPGAQLEVPWPKEFSGLVYVLGGRGYAGAERRPVDGHDLVVFGPTAGATGTARSAAGRPGPSPTTSTDVLTVEAAEHQPGDGSGDLEVLLLGGLPIREPIAHYGPFLMNTRAEIVQAIEDYQSGRMGRIPAVTGYVNE